MDEPDNPVLVLICYRITRVLRFGNDPHILFQRKVAVEHIHIGTRKHNLAGQQIGELEDIVHQLHFVLVDDAAFGTLIHQDPDFFFRVGRFGLTGRFYPDHFQQSVRRGVQHPDERHEHIIEEHQRS
ncbi:hypothetical protein D3C73_1208180 [compost metagenome]